MLLRIGAGLGLDSKTCAYCSSLKKSLLERFSTVQVAQHSLKPNADLTMPGWIPLCECEPTSAWGLGLGAWL